LLQFAILQNYKYTGPFCILTDQLCSTSHPSRGSYDTSPCKGLVSFTRF